MNQDLSPENTEKLVQFQELSGIEDLEACTRILERHNWDVETAIHDHLGLDPRERTPPVVPLTPENGIVRNGRMDAFRPAQVHRVGGRLPNDSFLQRIMTFFFNPFVDDNNQSLWSLHNQRPQGFTGWLLFLTSLPIRIAIVTFYKFTSFVLRIVWPEQRPALIDPTGNVVSFIQEYDTQFGSQHPNFYAGTYNQALNEAKKDLKFLLVYLHSKDHQETDRFCRRTLADRQVVEYVNNNMLMWACSVDTLEGYRVSQSLRENTYPFIAVIVQRDFRMTVVGRIEGFVPAETFIQRITSVVSDNEAFLVVARADRQERSFTQALRQEQDEAYLESLRLDQEKEEKKRRERLLEEERQREEKEQKEAEIRKKEEMIRRKIDAVNYVPEEPAPEERGLCRILVRLPKGQKLERRFIREVHTLKELYYFILSHPDSPYQFEMVTNFPKRTLEWKPEMEAHPTLAEVGLGASEAILVIDLDA